MATIGTILFTILNGKKVGIDEFGNKYYIHKKLPKRWVIYKGLAEPSKVPPLWHGWLHYMTDILPTEMDSPKYDWMKPHLPNLTGTKAAHKSAKITKTIYKAWSPNE